MTLVDNVEVEGRLVLRKTAYLLLAGKLPSRKELDFVPTAYRRESRLPDGFLC